MQLWRQAMRRRSRAPRRTCRPGKLPSRRRRRDLRRPAPSAEAQPHPAPPPPWPNRQVLSGSCGERQDQLCRSGRISCACFLLKSCNLHIEAQSIGGHCHFLSTHRAPSTGSFPIPLTTGGGGGGGGAVTTRCCHCILQQPPRQLRSGLAVLSAQWEKSSGGVAPAEEPG